MRYPSLRKSGWRKIRSSSARFLSILLMIALGAFVFVGLVSTAPSLERTLYTYLDQHQKADITVSHPLGLDDEDQAKLERLEKVSSLVYVHQVQQVVAETDHVLILESLEALPSFVVHQGRLPQRAGEIALSQSLQSSYELGQVLTIDSGGKDEDPLLHTDTFTVTGFIDSPDYLSEEMMGSVSAYGDGSVTGFGIVTRDVFVAEDPAMARLLFSDVQGLEAGSPIYHARMKAHEEEVRRLFDDRPGLREDSLRESGNAGLNQAEDALDQGQRDLAAGRRTLDQAQAQLDQARQLQDQAQRDLVQKEAQAQRGLVQAQQELSQSRQTLSQASDQILAAEAELLAGRESLAQGQRALAPLEQSLRQEAQALEKARARSRQASQAAQTAQRDLQAAQRELAQGQAALDGAKQDLQRNQAALRQGQADAQAAQGTLSQGQIALQAAESQIAGLGQKLQGQEAALRQTQDLLTQAKAQAGPEPTPAQTADIARLESQVRSQTRDVQASQALLRQGQQTVDRERRALAQGKVQAQQAQEQIASSEQAIATGQARLQQEQAQLDQARQRLATAQAEFDRQSQGLRAIEGQLAQGEASLRAGQTRLTQEKEGLTQGQAALAQAQRELDQAKQELFQGQEKLAQGESDLARQRQALQGQLQEGQNQLDQSRRTLAQSQEEIRQNRQAYEGAYDDRLADLQEGRDDIRQGRVNLLRIQVPAYTVQSWANDPVIDNFAQSAQGMRLMSAIFPAFFYGICLLICLTTMTRMIDDERSEIGTLKGLGYPNSAIMSNYMAYGAFAAIPGTILGILCGYKILMPVIVDAYYAGSVFRETLSVLQPYVPASALVLDLACTSLAAYSAARLQLRSPVATLLRPVPPKAGTRIFLERIRPFWSRLNFNQKITFRNLFRYKKRGALTIIGVAGCMALITMGFGLNYAISGIFDRQFGDLQHYDLIALYDDKASTTDQEDALAIFMQDGVTEDAVAARYETAVLPMPGASDQSLTLVTPTDPVAFRDLVVLRDPNTGAPLDLANGAVLSQKTARLLDIQPGDVLTYETSLGEVQTVPIAGITENYVGHMLYISPDHYQDLFDKTLSPNALYLAFTDPSQTDDLAQGFLTSAEAFGALKASSASDQVGDLTESLEIVVQVIVIVSLLLALVVLYNLTNINVEERMRELSTIKVLGFYPLEVTAYIYRESFALTLVGIGLGAVLGKALHTLIARALAPASFMMVEVVLPQDYLFGALFTLAASFIVMMIMHRKLKHVDMVEALKGVE